jgi:ubiquinone/menaquinone biosynthesis C-methylase UbiE
MRWLESTPSRYDRGIGLLSGGRIDSVYRRIAELVAAPGVDLLDVGCGTGGVALACAARGARVTGIDRDAGMLEIAASKAGDASVEWVEIGASEIEDRFAPERFDAIVSCLVFSEMSPDERSYVLEIARSRLRAGGRIVIADEVEPERMLSRLVYRLGRLPVVAATWLLTQTSTRPVHDLGAAFRGAGFADVAEEHPWPSFLIAQAVKPS